MKGNHESDAKVLMLKAVKMIFLISDLGVDDETNEWVRNVIRKIYNLINVKTFLSKLVFVPKNWP